MSEPRKTRRTAGRPSRSILTPQTITAAALEVIRGKGYSGFTMSALAAQLGVAPSALYNHAASKQEVLRWIQDSMMSAVDVDCFGTQPWESAVRRWAHSYRDVFAGHTPLIPVIAVLQISGAPRTLAMYEAVTAGFMAAGWPLPRIVPAIVALESFIFGSALDAGAPADIFDTGTLAAQSPLFTAAVAVQEGRADGTAADTSFETGLDALIRGLAGGAKPA